MKSVLIPAVILCLFAAGCASSKITTAWRTPDAIPGNYKKILVLGIINKNDRSIREKMETHFVGDLSGLGYTAIASLPVYGPRSFEKMTEPEIMPLLANSGADAAVTIVLLNRHREFTYVTPANPYPGGLGRYVRDRYITVFQPGYYVSSTKYLWETNLYDIKTGKLVYSVQTESFSPESIESMGHEYGRLIVKDMVKKGVLSQQPKI